MCPRSGVSRLTSTRRGGRRAGREDRPVRQGEELEKGHWRRGGESQEEGGRAWSPRSDTGVRAARQARRRSGLSSPPDGTATGLWPYFPFEGGGWLYAALSTPPHPASQGGSSCRLLPPPVSRATWQIRHRAGSLAWAEGKSAEGGEGNWVAIGYPSCIPPPSSVPVLCCGSLFSSMCCGGRLRGTCGGYGSRRGSPLVEAGTRQEIPRVSLSARRHREATRCCRNTGPGVQHSGHTSSKTHTSQTLTPKHRHARHTPDVTTATPAAAAAVDRDDAANGPARSPPLTGR